MAYTDIIVAVHGIGKQNRCKTVRSTANRLAAAKSLLGRCELFPVAPQPLGYFHPQTHSDVQPITSVMPLDDISVLKGSRLEHIGFAEVFWADIPQEVGREERTLEETKAWGRP